MDEGEGGSNLFPSGVDLFSSNLAPPSMDQRRGTVCPPPPRCNCACHGSLHLKSTRFDVEGSKGGRGSSSTLCWHNMGKCFPPLTRP